MILNNRSLIDLIIIKKDKTLWKVLHLKRFLKQFMEKNTATHTFSRKAIFRTLCCYLLVNRALQMTLIKYLSPEPTRTGHLQPSVTLGENLGSIESQIHPQA